MASVIKADTLAQIAAHDSIRPVRFSAVIGIWALLSVILLVIAAPNIVAVRFPDPDDLLRLLQVRDWLNGQEWYDVKQYRMNAPDGAPMHWSRIVDLPIAIIITVLTPILGSSSAEMAALIIIPAITLLCVMWAVAQLTNRLGIGSSGRDAAYLACLIVGMLVPVIHQLRPMRIDHHGWQIFLALLALKGLLHLRPERGALLSGVALAVWLSISMEGLPMAAGFMAAFAILWLCNAQHRGLLVTAMSGLTAASAILFMATRIFSADGWVQYCDAISPVHIGVFALGTGMLAILSRINPAQRLAIVAGFGFTGSAALALLYSAAPQCASGAFGQLDPLVDSFWYQRVYEGLPLWQQTTGKIIQNIAIPAIALFALLIHWLRFNRRNQADMLQNFFNFLQTAHGRTAFMLLVAIAIASLVERAAGVACIFALPIAANLLILLLKKVRRFNSPLARIGGTLGVFTMIVPGLLVAPASALISKRAQKFEELTAIVQDAEKCQQIEQLRLIQELPVGNIMTPLDMGPAILFASDHKVVASGHHRNDTAMRDVLNFFSGNKDAAYSIAKQRDIDYVMYCENVAEVMLYAHYKPDGFMAELRNDNVPQWLEPVTLYGAEGLRVWRVKR
ncbi:hypothetical protein ACR9YC_00185 [Parasphingorhabdus sp. DH2-15]|uniref:hypothetical protein n=1 Tax=Parasphingorhabdus sp. DH2-15 TaxID=3444112 RepID=UPI003F685C74